MMAPPSVPDRQFALLVGQGITPARVGRRRGKRAVSCLS